MSSGVKQAPRRSSRKKKRHHKNGQAKNAPPDPVSCLAPPLALPLMPPPLSPRKQFLERHRASDESLDSLSINKAREGLRSSRLSVHAPLVPSSPTNEEKLILFKYTESKITVYDAPPSGSRPLGRLLAHGEFEIFQLHKGDVTYLACGLSFVYPLLPKLRILRVSYNEFVLPLVNPERYWRMHIVTALLQAIDALESALASVVSYRNLYLLGMAGHDGDAHNGKMQEVEKTGSPKLPLEHGLINEIIDSDHSPRICAGNSVNGGSVNGDSVDSGNSVNIDSVDSGNSGNIDSANAGSSVNGDSANAGNSVDADSVNDNSSPRVSLNVDRSLHMRADDSPRLTLNVDHSLRINSVHSPHIRAEDAPCLTLNGEHSPHICGEHSRHVSLDIGPSVNQSAPQNDSCPEKGASNPITPYPHSIDDQYIEGPVANQSVDHRSSFNWPTPSFGGASKNTSLSNRSSMIQGETPYPSQPLHDLSELTNHPVEIDSHKITDARNSRHLDTMVLPPQHQKGIDRKSTPQSNRSSMIQGETPYPSQPLNALSDLTNHPVEIDSHKITDTRNSRHHDTMAPPPQHQKQENHGNSTTRNSLLETPQRPNNRLSRFLLDLKIVESPPSPGMLLVTPQQYMSPAKDANETPYPFNEPSRGSVALQNTVHPQLAGLQVPSRPHWGHSESFTNTNPFQPKHAPSPGARSDDSLMDSLLDEFEESVSLAEITCLPRSASHQLSRLSFSVAGADGMPPLLGRGSRRSLKSELYASESNWMEPNVVPRHASRARSTYSGQSSVLRSVPVPREGATSRIYRSVTQRNLAATSQPPAASVRPGPAFSGGLGQPLKPATPQKGFAARIFGW